MKLLCHFAVVALVVATFAACSKQPGHDHAAPTAARHEHAAPHGGTLVEIGEHAYNLEIVRDAATGRLAAFVFDGHVENFIRLKAPAFEVVATVGGEKRPLTFRAVANPATGETVGDTAQFETQADWLKTTATFDAVIPALTIKGTAFTAIAFNFPKGG